MGFLLRAVVTAIGLWLATQWVQGVRVVVNAIIRPLAFILTLPITILTLGLFLFVLNAAMVWLVAAILPGFHAPWFMPAFLTSIIVWLTGWVGSWFIGHRGFERYARR